MEQYQETVGGLHFDPPAAARRGQTSGKALSIWGNLLRDGGQFQDTAGFRAAMDTMDVVEERPVFVDFGNGHGVRQTEDFKAIVSKQTGRIYHVPTDEYVVVQDREVAGGLADAAESRGLVTLGRIDGVGSGKTRGHVVFANPEFRVRLLEEYDDDIMLGVRFYNSFDGLMSYGLEAFGIRMVCINYNLWGSILGRVWQKHLGANPETILKDFDRLLQGILEGSKTLSALVQKAAGMVVFVEQVPDLLWGVGMPVRGVRAVSSDLAGFAPEVAQLGLSSWTLYNAATAYITWREGSGKYLESTENYARQAADLLTVNQDKVLVRGKERREAYEEAAKAREQKKLEVRTVA